jgi:zinc protease
MTATALVLLVFSFGGLGAQASLGPDQVVPLDPSTTVGTLSNGLTYYIRLVVNAGSVLEDDDQLGLAHFVEHMAFNGTEHFEKQELVEYLESIGMQFGPSINAFTSFDETVYQLFVPTDDPEILSTAFQILEDWAHGVTFDPEEVDKERGVVIEEWRLGLGAMSRLRDQQLPTLFANSRYKDRLPIGTPEILESFERESLTRFYTDWYRPELMAVIAIGDFDAGSVEDLVERHFSGLESAPTSRERTYYDVPGHEETFFAIATDPEVTATQISVTYKRPAAEQGTVGVYRTSLVEALYDAMLNNRLFELTQKPDAPFLFGVSGQARIVRTTELYQLSAVVRDGAVGAGLDALLVEAERVARYGFAPSELERQKTELLRGLEMAYAERENRESRSFASEYQRAFLEGEPIPGIEWEYRVAEALLATVTVEEMNALARELISDRNRVILVSAPDKPDFPPPSEAQLLAAFDRVAMAEIEPYEDAVTDSPLIASVPDAGSVLSRERIEELDVTVLELSNGARVMLKATDFKDDEIVFRAYSPGGYSLAGDAVYASASMADQLVAQGGVGAFSVVELQKLLAGKAAGVAPSINALTEGFSGGASPKDVETLFQLIHLYFTSPRKDAEAFEAFRQRVGPMLANRGASPDAHFGDTLNAVLSQDHPRRRPPTEAWLSSLDLDTAYDFYQDRFSDAGDFTFVFVGAFEEAEIEPLVQTYLGSLPSTGRSETWRDEGIHTPDGVIEKYVRKGLEPRSQTRLVFSGDFGYTSENRAAMRVLAEVLQLRLRERLREDLGGTYSVSANAGYGRYPRPEYTFSVSFGADPDRLEELVGVVFDEIDTLKSVGASPEDLDKIREQDRRSLETSRESNAWWAGQLQASDFEGLDPRRLIRDDLLDDVTPEAVRAAAQRWLRMDRYVRVSLVPEGGPAM